MSWSVSCSMSMKASASKMSCMSPSLSFSLRPAAGPLARLAAGPASSSAWAATHRVGVVGLVGRVGVSVYREGEEGRRFVDRCDVQRAGPHAEQRVQPIHTMHPIHTLCVGCCQGPRHAPTQAPSAVLHHHMH